MEGVDRIGLPARSRRHHVPGCDGVHIEAARPGIQLAHEQALVDPVNNQILELARRVRGIDPDRLRHLGKRQRALLVRQRQDCQLPQLGRLRGAQLGVRRPLPGVVLPNPASKEMEHAECARTLWVLCKLMVSEERNGADIPLGRPARRAARQTQTHLAPQSPAARFARHRRRARPPRPRQTPAPVPAPNWRGPSWWSQWRRTDVSDY